MFIYNFILYFSIKIWLFQKKIYNVFLVWGCTQNDNF